MYVRLEKRADGMPDQQVDCDVVAINAMSEETDKEVALTVEHDTDLDEVRVIVDDECVFSALLGKQ